MTSPHELALLRLAAQRLVGPPCADATAAVRWLGAVQGQDRPGAVTSVALRTADRSRAGVLAAFDAGEVVTSWPMRGTLHLVPAEDLGWMLEVAGPRALVGAAARRAALGLDERDLERARELATEALVGGRRLTRADVLRVWDDGGLVTTGQRGYHLLWYLAQTGTLCFGPTAEKGEQAVVLLHEWVPKLRRLARDEALGQWALRYFRSHGPATTKDFARWTGLLAADVRTGAALARPHLTTLDVDGVEHLLDPQTPELLEASRRTARGVLLLPGFDELVLGYADRSCTVPAAFADRIVPGGNGIFRPTVIADGRAVGTWKHGGAARRVQAEPFEAFTAAVAKAVPRAAAALPA